eukprot:CAMPEP_0198284622 /NCGR_PEP_ID=MMETSP1449-20131203/4078_1 /TAXON_ID=420275 /ORGANISM="Attheya septentrionalis, Strain CCMP2084" /LENGTH=370 /DNA_ID=CAMNT_0043981783 /DNA_START=322 /DNA_END=1431 /DNA_ORIENTATION=+
MTEHTSNKGGLCTESAGCIVSRTLPDLCFGSAFSLLVLFYAQLAATAAGGARAGSAHSYYVLEGHFFRTANMFVYGSYAILFLLMSLWVHIHHDIDPNNNNINNNNNNNNNNNDTVDHAMTSTSTTHYQMFQAIVWGLLCVLYMALFWAVVYFGPALLHLVQPSLVQRQRSALARRLVGTCALCGMVFLGRSIVFAWATFQSMGCDLNHNGNLFHHLAHQMSHFFVPKWIQQSQDDNDIDIDNDNHEEEENPFATYFRRDCIEYVLLELIPSFIILLLMHQKQPSSSTNNHNHGSTTTRSNNNNNNNNNSNPHLASRSSNTHTTAHNDRSSPADSVDSSTRYPSYGGTTTATATSTLRNNSSWVGGSGET